MKFIDTFKEDDNIVGHYLCKQKQSLKTQAGKTYYSLELQDKTSTITAKVWDLTKDIGSFDEKDMIKIDGMVLIYKGTPQLKITKIRKSREGEYDPTDYIPSTDKDIEQLYSDMLALIESISVGYLKKLLQNIFLHDKHVVAHIKTHSAARNFHHGYLGGLIEHSVSVAQLCDFLAPRYKYVNRDLLITGALIHDMGKLYELSTFPDNEYTDEGELMGHIVIGIEMLTVKASEIEGFPTEALKMLKHLIISHHGELEFGSPQKPKTIEAIILHSADKTDSAIKMYEEVIDKSLPHQGKGWSDFQNTVKLKVRKPVALDE